MSDYYSFTGKLTSDANVHIKSDSPKTGLPKMLQMGSQDCYDGLPDLVKEVASNLNISASNDTSQTTLEGNFVEKVSQILNEDQKFCSMPGDITEMYNFKAADYNPRKVKLDRVPDSLIDTLDISSVRDESSFMRKLDCIIEKLDEDIDKQDSLICNQLHTKENEENQLRKADSLVDSSLDFSNSARDNILKKSAVNLSFNDTLEEMEFFLSQNCKSSTNQIEIHDSHSEAAVNIEFSAMDNEKTLPTAFNTARKELKMPKSNTRFENILSPVACYIHEPRAGLKQNKRTPGKPDPQHLPQFTTKMGIYKDVLSPVSLYIKNTPCSPLVQKIANKATKEVVFATKTVQKSATRDFENLPKVTYKPAKYQQVAKEQDIKLPGSIRKLMPRPTEVIKHENRYITKEENDLIESSIDSSLPRHTYDISVVTSKNQYIK